MLSSSRPLTLSFWLVRATSYRGGRRARSGRDRRRGRGARRRRSGGRGGRRAAARALDVGGGNKAYIAPLLDHVPPAHHAGEHPLGVTVDDVEGVVQPRHFLIHRVAGLVRALAQISHGGQRVHIGPHVLCFCEVTGRPDALVLTAEQGREEILELLFGL